MFVEIDDMGKVKRMMRKENREKKKRKKEKGSMIEVIEKYREGRDELKGWEEKGYYEEEEEIEEKYGNEMDEIKNWDGKVKRIDEVWEDIRIEI